MEAALVLIATSVGIVIGLIAIDMSQRLQDRKALKEAERVFIQTQKDLAELHNSATQNLKDLSDKVGGLEMAVKGANQVTPIKRF